MSREDGRLIRLFVREYCNVTEVEKSAADVYDRTGKRGGDTSDWVNVVCARPG